MIYNVLHAIVDIFASGRSPIKILLFGTAIAVFLGILFRMRKHSRAHVGDLEKEATKRDAFFALAGGLFLFGLGTTFYYYYSLGLGGTDTLLLTLAERGISITHLFHSHVLKFSFGVFGGLIPLPLRLSVENGLDFGFTYNSMLPAVVGYIGAIGCVALAALSVRFLDSFMRQHKGRIGLQILFLIGLFSVLKNVFDGGLLNHEAIPAFLLVWAMSHPHAFSKPKQWIIPVALQVLPFVALTYAAITGSITDHGIVEYPQTLFGLELLYFGLYGLCGGEGIRGKRFSKLAAVLLLALGIYGTLPVEQRAIGSFQYAAIPVEDRRAFIGTYDDKSPFGSFVEKIGDMSFYILSTSTHMTTGELADALGEPLTYSPVYVEGRSCPSHWPNKVETYGVVTKETLSKPVVTHQFANIAGLHFLGAKNGWNHYRVTTSMIACIPRNLDVASELLREAGAVHMVTAVPMSLARLLY